MVSVTLVFGLAGCQQEGPATREDEPAVSTEEFLAQLDLVALEGLEVISSSSTGLEVVEHTILWGENSTSASVHILGTIENQSTTNQCGIEVDYFLSSEDGSPLTDFVAVFWGSMLSRNGVNVSRCLRPGERGHFSGPGVLDLGDVVATVDFELTTLDREYVESAQDVVAQVTQIDSTGDRTGSVEATLENVGSGSAELSDAAVFIQAADGTFTDHDVEFGVSGLSSGESITIDFIRLAIPRDGEAFVYIKWD